MLSIGTLNARRMEYYLASVGRGVDDYYSGVGEAPGRWVGSGSPALGLEGRVEEHAFRAVLRGRDPTTYEQLGQHRAGRTLGYDLCFRAPKSVSLTWALADVPVGIEIVAAHHAAVTASLNYLERHAAFARRGRNGTVQVTTTGFVGAAFGHRTSRALDPHLHTHIVVANVAERVDEPPRVR